MSNKMGGLKYSEADQVAAEKQILNFQKITNYRMKEYSIEERPLKIAAEGKVKYKKTKV